MYIIGVLDGCTLSIKLFLRLVIFLFRDFDVISTTNCLFFYYFKENIYSTLIENVIKK